MIWDMRTVSAVRGLRSKSAVTLYELDNADVSRTHYLRHLSDRAARNLIDAAHAYGVDIDPQDIKHWEEPYAETEPETGDLVQHIAIGARWFNTVGSIELVGGPLDGERHVVNTGAVGQELYFPMPVPDPMYDQFPGQVKYEPFRAPSGDTIPHSDLRKITYGLMGWNDTARVWVYGPIKNRY